MKMKTEMKTNAQRQQRARIFTCDCDICEPMTSGAKGGARGGACHPAPDGPVGTPPAVASVVVVAVTVVVVVCVCVWSSRIGIEYIWPCALVGCMRTCAAAAGGLS